MGATIKKSYIDILRTRQYFSLQIDMRGKDFMHALWVGLMKKLGLHCI